MEIESDGAFFGQKGDFFAGDFTLERRLLREPWHDALKAMRIESSAGHIFTACTVSALNDQHVQSGLSHNVACNRTRHASTDHNGIKFFI